jgi:hypothetical protein
MQARTEDPVGVRRDFQLVSSTRSIAVFLLVFVEGHPDALTWLEALPSHLRDAVPELDSQLWLRRRRLDGTQARRGRGRSDTRSIGDGRYGRDRRNLGGGR